MKKFPTISELTKNPCVMENGAHILYMFNEIDKYIENAVRFIQDGLKQPAIVLVIESAEIIRKLKKQLTLMDIQPHNITFLETEEFYFNGEEYDVINAGNKLRRILQPYIDLGLHIRTWGKVPLSENGTGLKQIITYECDCDPFIINHSMISVCTYHDLSTPAYLQNELLKTHTHLLTDDMYSLSPFYHQKYHHSLTNEKILKLQKVEEQNIELINKNSDLAFENNLVKMKNEYIKQNENKLRTIINELPIPIVIRRGTTVLFSNELAQQLFMVNEKITDLYSFFQHYDQTLQHTLKNNKQEHPYIFNTKQKCFLVNSIEISFEEEAALLHSFVDITKEKENERLIVRSEKMNIAGELAASIAHELRNPLTAIKGFFAMIKHSKQNEKEMYFNIIDDELSRIEQISSELLTLAKPHSDNRKRYNLVHLIEEVKLLLMSQANMKSIEMITHTSNEEMYINCEGTKIKQVFINLIKNAIDAMESNGQIDIHINRIRNHIQVQVMDQGKGIPKSLLKKIGEPFYTTKEKGTGLGLMVCFQIIERHEGTIQVVSEEGKGTTFTITLPVPTESLTSI